MERAHPVFRDKLEDKENGPPVDPATFLKILHLPNIGSVINFSWMFSISKPLDKPMAR